MRLSLLWELVSQGVGIAVVPRSSPGSGAKVTLVQITRPRLRVRIVLASGETTPSPAARAFLGLVSSPVQADERAMPDGRAPHVGTGKPQNLRKSSHSVRRVAGRGQAED
jgi:hypothetical protein